MRCMKHAAAVVLILSFSYWVGCGEANSQQSWLEPLGTSADWQTQDWVDSQGIRGVRLDKGRLALDAHFTGQHQNYSKGEVYLDLRYVPGIDGKAPLDFRNRTVTVQVHVPAGFVGWASAPNGVQVFVKDREGRCQYSKWRNVEYQGKHTVALGPTAGGIAGGYTGAGFDPGEIILIGVKLAIGSGSSATYDGPLSVEGVTISPGIALSVPPPLPTSAPIPVLWPQDKVEVKSDGFYLNGAKWFVVGGNWRAIEYGQNFGATAWFPTGNGVSKHPGFIRASLADLRRSGVKVLRVGLLDDGRTMFDRDGRVTGYNDTFRTDVKKFLDLVVNAGLRVEFTLVDFLLAGKRENIDDVVVRGRSAVMADEARTEEFIDRFLEPFLKEFGHHPAVIGFDIVNEPEWVVAKGDGGGWEDVTDIRTKAITPVPGQEFGSFVRACIETIRAHAPGKLVTVGVSCTHVDLVKGFDIDYYALHHYPWMGDLRDLAPLVPEGKPWVLEEYPTHGSAPSISGHLDLVSELGGSGALLWNLSPGIDSATFRYEDRNKVLLEIRTWVDGHSAGVYAGTTHKSSTNGGPSAHKPPARKLRPKGPAAVGSPHGDVPFGARAYSPDGRMFAREIAPVNRGMIGVIDAVTGEQLHAIDTDQHPQGNFANDLKGLAWSPNSELIAVMYHHDGGGHISIVRVSTGEEAQSIDIDDWYHDVTFSSDGRKIQAGGKSFSLK